MTDHEHGIVDRRATGVRAFLVCGLIGLIWLIVLACSQVVAWGQVPLGGVYPGVLTLVNVAFWASALALFVSSLRVLRLNARRASWGLLVAAGAFVVIAFRPPEPVALAMVALAAAAAVQAGFLQGDLGGLVRFAAREDESVGKAQAILNGWFTFGLAPAVWGSAWLATEFTTGVFAVLAVACVASWAIVLGMYRRSRPPRRDAVETTRPASGAAVSAATSGGRSAPPGAGGWSRGTAWGFVLNALSSGTTAANLATLPAVLAQEGYGGPSWQAVAFAMHVPAAAVVLTVWTRVSHRLRHNGIRLVAVAQAVGTLLLAVSLWLDWGFLAWLLVGFVLLNAARAAYNGSALVCVGATGANATVLLIAAGLGAAVGVQLATAVLEPGGLSPSDAGLAFGALCLAATLIRPPGRGRAALRDPYVGRHRLF